MARRTSLFVTGTALLTSLFALPAFHATAAQSLTSALVLSPTSDMVGKTVQVTGSGPRSFKGSAVQIVWNGTTTVATTSVTGSGAYSAQFVVPSTSASTYVVSAVERGVIQAQANFTVLATVPPTMTSTPAATVTPTSTATPQVTATSTAVPTSTSLPTNSAIPTGALGPSGSLFTSETQAGLGLTQIALSWSSAEPSNGSYSESYFQSIRNEITQATAAGLTPVLSLGLQYAPAWAFNLDPASRFVDQYGDVWSASTGSGEGVVNGVFSSSVRQAISLYVQKVFSELGTSFVSVRWGGGLPYDEVRYPGCPSGRSNCYWAFDANAKQLSPVPNYVPGSGDPTQAQTFLNWYLSSIRQYIAWGLGVIRQFYSGNIDVLFPSWGVRPGDLTTAVASNLNGTTSRTSEITAGLDWQSQLPADAQYGAVVAWSTWLNRQDDASDVASWSPIHYLSSILPAGMGLGGENTDGKATTSDLNDTFTNARTYHLRRVLWMNEADTQITGNATIQQLGAAAQGH